MREIGDGWLEKRERVWFEISDEAARKEAAQAASTATDGADGGNEHLVGLGQEWIVRVVELHDMVCGYGLGTRPVRSTCQQRGVGITCLYAFLRL